MYMFLLEQQDVYQDKVPYKSSVWLWNVYVVCHLIV